MGDAWEELLQVEVLPGKVMGEADWKEDEQVAKTRQYSRILKELEDFFFFFFLQKPKCELWCVASCSTEAKLTNMGKGLLQFAWIPWKL